jgi:hypothetical protein
MIRLIGRQHAFRRAVCSAAKRPVADIQPDAVYPAGFPTAAALAFVLVLAGCGD